MNMLHANKNRQTIQPYCKLPESFPGVAVMLVRTVQKEWGGGERNEGGQEREMKGGENLAISCVNLLRSG